MKKLLILAAAVMLTVGATGCGHHWCGKRSSTFCNPCNTCAPACGTCGTGAPMLGAGTYSGAATVIPGPTQ